jgi:hypothetical protein
MPMNNVRIDKVTVTGLRGHGTEAAARQARKIAELLGKALPDGEVVVVGGGMLVVVRGGAQRPPERCAELAVRQLKMRWG